MLFSYHNAVFEIQEKVIAQVRPGNSLKELHDLSCRITTEKLIEIGLLHGEVDTLLREGAFRAYYPHTIGHHLGLDVHDCGDLSREERGRSAEFKLSSRMVITIEPGIYIQPDDLSVDEKWRGIGVRIEDNILVTPEGCENLSAAAIK